MPYLPGLDGMRALAVVAVILYHTNNGWLPGGFIGVEVFFVISGYLITLLLIGEHEKTGRIALKEFWMRRARRLLPALFLMMALLMVYSAIFERDTLGKLRGDVIAGVAYVTNWYQIWTGAGYTALLDFAPLRHLWSLAVEEQFYLIWPLVMVALMRLGRRRLPEISRWLVLTALLLAVITGLLYHPGQLGTPDVAPEAFWSVGGHSVSKMDALYLSTFTRATGLLLGAALAMIWRPVAVMRGPMRDKGLLLDGLAVLGLGALGALAWFLHVQVDGRADPWLFRGGFLATDFATLLVIAAVTHRGAKMGMFLGAQPLHWIGTRSYGLYLYHWPIFEIIRGNAGATLTVPEFVGAMVLTCVITELSYRYVEMPIRRRQLGKWLDRARDVHDPRQRQALAVGAVACVAAFGFAAVSMFTAPLKQNEVQASLEAAEGDITDVGALLESTTTAAAVADVDRSTGADRRASRRRPDDGPDVDRRSDDDGTASDRSVSGDRRLGDGGSGESAEGRRVHRRRCREPPVRRLPADQLQAHRRQRSAARGRRRPPRHEWQHQRGRRPRVLRPVAGCAAGWSCSPTGWTVRGPRATTS